MTPFENRTLRDLVGMKSRELEKEGTEEAVSLAEELRELVKRIYGHQQANNGEREE